MVSSTEAYQGLKNEDAVRLYLQEEKMMSQYEIDDFMRVYETLSIAEVSELLFEMIGKEIYRTYPPDMKTFIHDPYFLGTIYGDSIFPVWNELLPEIYPAPLCKAYEEIILSTATRCGKSTCIAISFAYEILLMLCMINPAKTLLGKASGSLVMHRRCLACRRDRRQSRALHTIWHQGQCRNYLENQQHQPVCLWLWRQWHVQPYLLLHRQFRHPHHHLRDEEDACQQHAGRDGGSRHLA